MVKKASLATSNLVLRALRKERGWTQQQVADYIGAPHSLNISRWENGTAFPSTYYLEKLCYLFGKTVRELGLSQFESETQAEAPSANEPGQVRPPTDSRMWTVPYPRNLFFLGREEELARLRRQLQADQAMDLSQPQAISGLGGIGKTQVVLEYAYRHAQDYQAALLVLRRAGLLALDAPLEQAEQADRQAAEDLSRQLGGLPLALDQAGAYLEETRCSLQHYLDLFKKHRADLLYRRGGLVLDHPDSVATTLSLSFASVERLSTAAASQQRPGCDTQLLVAETQQP